MHVKFYGTRGSIPVPERNFITFGGNTSCIRVRFDKDQLLILKAGSGMRKLEEDLLLSSYQSSSIS